MKRNRNALYIMPLLVLALMLGACHKNVVTAPVPGQLNTFDAYAYRVLADTQAALNDFKASVTSGKVQETPQIKAILNQAITDYNVANATYQAWHAAGGTGPTTQLSNQLSAVQADISRLPATGGK